MTLQWTNNWNYNKIENNDTNEDTAMKRANQKFNMWSLTSCIQLLIFNYFLYAKLVPNIVIPNELGV